MIVINEKKNEKKIEKIFNKEKLKFPEKNIFFNPNIDTALKVGIDKRKDIFAESYLLKLNNLAALIVIPDLLTPGIKENI